MSGMTCKRVITVLYQFDSWNLLEQLKPPRNGRIWLNLLRIDVFGWYFVVNCMMMFVPWLMQEAQFEIRCANPKI